MKKYIEIAEEVLSRLDGGKYVEGSLHRDKGTGRLTFNGYNRQKAKPRKADRLICQLESGWLKESPRRYKFFSSVKKTLGHRLVNVAMHRDLNTAMERLEVEEIIDRV